MSETARPANVPATRLRMTASLASSPTRRLGLWTAGPVSGLASSGNDSSAGARPSREPVALAVALLCTFSPTVAGAVQALRARASGRAHLFPVSSPGNDLPSGTPCSRNDYIGRESMLADRIRKHIQNLPLFLDAAENLKDIVRAWMPTSP